MALRVSEPNVQILALVSEEVLALVREIRDKPSLDEHDAPGAGLSDSVSEDPGVSRGAEVSVAG